MISVKKVVCVLLSVLYIGVVALVKALRFVHTLRVVALVAQRFFVLFRTPLFAGVKWTFGEVHNMNTSQWNARQLVK